MRSVARMRLRFGGVCLALAISACARAPAAPPAPGELVVSLNPWPPFEDRDLARRWRGSDVFEYELSLLRWDGSRFAELDPALRVTLPQQGEPRREARFANLRHGERYRVEVLARGNVGGTAPERILNSEIPCMSEIDLSQPQDAESTITRSLKVWLDPVPFSGTLEVAPRNAPSFVRTFSLELRDADSGETRLSETFTRAQTMILSNLRTGVAYQVVLMAYRANGQLYRTLTGPIVRFDPEADALEQVRRLELSF